MPCGDGTNEFFDAYAGGETLETIFGWDGVPRERFPPLPGLCYNPTPAGEMDEWFKSHAWKACSG